MTVPPPPHCTSRYSQWFTGSCFFRFLALPSPPLHPPPPLWTVNSAFVALLEKWTHWFDYKWLRDTAAPPNSLYLSNIFPSGLKFKKSSSCRCCVFLTVLSEVLWPIISGVFSPNPNNLFSWFAPKTAATVTTLFSQTFNWQQQHRGVRCSPLPPRWFPWFTLCLCLPSPYPHPPMSQGQRLEFSNFNIEVQWSIVNIHNMRRGHLQLSLQFV